MSNDSQSPDDGDQADWTPTTLYRFFAADGDLLYVGITVNGRGRWHNHAADKAWWSDVVGGTIEHHPSRDVALAAETAAIIAERPRHNVVHNRSRPPRPLATRREVEAPWTFYNRRHGDERHDRLWLYPEIDGSSCVDDVWDEPGEEQVAYFVDRTRRCYPEEWAADRVPIYWSLRGDHTHEAAPLQEHFAAGDNFLTYFTWPTDSDGRPCDWFTLPVRNDRFPEFGKALGWLPSPLQPFCRLRSLYASKLGIHPEAAR